MRLILSVVGKNTLKKGDKVLIKPNLLTAALPQKAVTTHPEVVRSLIKAVKKIRSKAICCRFTRC